MPIVCTICGEKITDGSKVPMWITVTGWDIDEGQYGFEICRTCLINKSKEILKKLEGGQYG